MQTKVRIIGDQCRDIVLKELDLLEGEDPETEVSRTASGFGERQLIV